MTQKPTMQLFSNTSEESPLPSPKGSAASPLIKKKVVKKETKRDKDKLLMNSYNTVYEVISLAAKKCGFRESK